MSSSFVRISSIAAFSYNWNKGIDSKRSYCAKFKNSIVAFLKGLFCKYKVMKCEVSNSGILGGSHENSIFVKEYRKLLEFKYRCCVKKPDYLFSSLCLTVLCTHYFPY